MVARIVFVLVGVVVWGGFVGGWGAGAGGGLQVEAQQVRSWFLADRTDDAVSSGESRPGSGKEWREECHSEWSRGSEEHGGRGSAMSCQDMHHETKH